MHPGCSRHRHKAHLRNTSSSASSTSSGGSDIEPRRPLSTRRTSTPEDAERDSEQLPLPAPPRGPWEDTLRQVLGAPTGDEQPGEGGCSGPREKDGARTCGCEKGDIVAWLGEPLNESGILSSTSTRSSSASCRDGEERWKSKGGERGGRAGIAIGRCNLLP